MIAGIRDINQQIDDLESILNYPAVSDNNKLVSTINDAINSTKSF